MSEDGQANAETKKGAGSTGKLVLWFLVVTLSIGGGFATPMLLAQLSAPKEPDKKKAEPLTLDPNEESVFISFPEVVAMLGKSSFNRYLRLGITLQVAKSQQTEVETKMAAKMAVLRDRILMYISEITEEDIAGKHGNTQLQRQIQTFFNEILFDDGIERVQKVLFTEFQVN